MYKILNVITGDYIVFMRKSSLTKGCPIYRDPLHLSKRSLQFFDECLFFTKIGARIRLWLSFRKTRYLYIIVKI